MKSKLFFALIILTLNAELGCNDAQSKDESDNDAMADASASNDAAVDTSVNATKEASIDALIDQSNGNCVVGSSCAFDCLSPEEASCWACGELTMNENCKCRPENCGAIPQCDEPGPAQEGEFCGKYWWCQRSCAEGLTCVEQDPCDEMDWKTVCRPNSQVPYRDDTCDDAGAE